MKGDYFVILIFFVLCYNERFKMIMICRVKDFHMLNFMFSECLKYSYLIPSPLPVLQSTFMLNAFHECFTFLQYCNILYKVGICYKMYYVNSKQPLYMKKCVSRLTASVMAEKAYLITL